MVCIHDRIYLGESFHIYLWVDISLHYKNLMSYNAAFDILFLLDSFEILFSNGCTAIYEKRWSAFEFLRLSHINKKKVYHYKKQLSFFEIFFLRVFSFLICIIIIGFVFICSFKSNYDAIIHIFSRL